MSVSAVAPGNVDLDALLGTEFDFQKRLTDLVQAKRNLDQAQADLQLAHGAAEAYARAKALSEQAARERDEQNAALQADMKRIRDELNAWVAQTRADESARLVAAQEALSAASDKHAAANTVLEQSKSALSVAQAQADQVLADARANADRIIAEAQIHAKNMKEAAERSLAQAQDSEQAMASARAEYEAKLAKLKAAISG